jgi:hypothetical protein
MGLKHEAKKGTIIEANGVTVRVLRGSPHLEITAPPSVTIKLGEEKTLPKPRRKPHNTRRLINRS